MTRDDLEASHSQVRRHAEFGSTRDYVEPPPAPFIDPMELGKWSFYRAVIAEFVATLLFLYITIGTVVGYKSSIDPLKNANSATDANCNGVGVLGIAWSFGGMIFILVYCTAGISGPNPLHPFPRSPNLGRN